jgi:hypothetical protein
MSIPSFADMFPSRWIKAEDIAGREVVATIESIGFEDFDKDINNPAAGKERRNTLKFVGGEKEMILNQTNGKTIFATYGEPENWIGKQVVLFTMIVQGPNGNAPGIRLRAHYGEPQALSFASPNESVGPDPALVAATAGNGAPPVEGNTVGGDDDLPF